MGVPGRMWAGCFEEPDKIFGLAVKVQIRYHFIKFSRGCKEF